MCIKLAYLCPGCLLPCKTTGAIIIPCEHSNVAPQEGPLWLRSIESGGLGRSEQGACRLAPYRLCRHYEKLPRRFWAPYLCRNTPGCIFSHDTFWEMVDRVENKLAWHDQGMPIVTLVYKKRKASSGAGEEEEPEYEDEQEDGMIMDQEEMTDGEMLVEGNGAAMKNGSLDPDVNTGAEEDPDQTEEDPDLTEEDPNLTEEDPDQTKEDSDLTEEEDSEYRDSFAWQPVFDPN